MTYQGRHRTPPPPATNPLNLPGAIDVHRVAGGFHNGELFLTILAESGRVSTFAIAGEALGTLREVLLERPIRIGWVRSSVAVGELPHSRACSRCQHEHGTACHSNCLTCGGRPWSA